VLRAIADKVNENAAALSEAVANADSGSGAGPASSVPMSAAASRQPAVQRQSSIAGFVVSRGVHPSAAARGAHGTGIDGRDGRDAAADASGVHTASSPHPLSGGIVDAAAAFVSSGMSSMVAAAAQTVQSGVAAVSPRKRKDRSDDSPGSKMPFSEPVNAAIREHTRHLEDLLSPRELKAKRVKLQHGVVDFFCSPITQGRHQWHRNCVNARLGNWEQLCTKLAGTFHGVSKPVGPPVPTRHNGVLVAHPDPMAFAQEGTGSGHRGLLRAISCQHAA